MIIILVSILFLFSVDYGKGSIENTITGSTSDSDSDSHSESNLVKKDLNFQDSRYIETVSYLPYNNIPITLLSTTTTNIKEYNVKYNIIEETSQVPGIINERYKKEVTHNYKNTSEVLEENVTEVLTQKNFDENTSNDFPTTYSSIIDSTKDNISTTTNCNKAESTTAKYVETISETFSDTSKSSHKTTQKNEERPFQSTFSQKSTKRVTWIRNENKQSKFTLSGRKYMNNDNKITNEPLEKSKQLVKVRFKNRYTQQTTYDPESSSTYESSEESESKSEDDLVTTKHNDHKTKKYNFHEYIDLYNIPSSKQSKDKKTQKPLGKNLENILKGRNSTLHKYRFENRITINRHKSNNEHTERKNPRQVPEKTNVRNGKREKEKQDVNLRKIRKDSKYKKNRSILSTHRFTRESFERNNKDGHSSHHKSEKKHSKSTNMRNAKKHKHKFSRYVSEYDENSKESYSNQRSYERHSRNRPKRHKSEKVVSNHNKRKKNQDKSIIKNKSKTEQTKISNAHQLNSNSSLKIIPSNDLSELLDKSYHGYASNQNSEEKKEKRKKNEKQKFNTNYFDEYDEMLKSEGNEQKVKRSHTYIYDSLKLKNKTYTCKDIKNKYKEICNNYPKDSKHKSAHSHKYKVEKYDTEKIRQKTKNKKQNKKRRKLQHSKSDSGESTKESDSKETFLKQSKLKTFKKEILKDKTTHKSHMRTSINKNEIVKHKESCKKINKKTDNPSRNGSSNNEHGKNVRSTQCKCQNKGTNKIFTKRPKNKTYRRKSRPGQNKTANIYLSSEKGQLENLQKLKEVLSLDASDIYLDSLEDFSEESGDGVVTDVIITFVVIAHGYITPNLTKMKIYAPALGEPPQVSSLRLTDLGKNQSYEAGAYLRHRYQKLLSPTYEPKEILARTIDTDYAKSSILLTLSALYPPQNESRRNAALSLQAVPYDAESVEDDDLRPFDNCPAYKTLRKNVLNETAVRKRLKSYGEEELPNINFFTGYTYTIEDLYDFHYLGNLISFVFKDQYPFDSANPCIAIKELSRQTFWTSLLNSTLVRFAAGVMMNEVLDAIDLVRDNVSTLNMYLVTGTDFNVAALMAASKVFALHQPQNGAIFSLEIFRAVDFDDYGVRAVYKPERSVKTKILKIKGCVYKNGYCSATDFQRLCKKYAMSAEQYKSECSKN